MKRALIPSLMMLGTSAMADPTTIQAVTATQTGGAWRFDVTVKHPDTGWDHYTDAWRILDMNGAELGMRVLHHPHVDEQPFTRSLSGVVIPDGVNQVQIQARCSVEGWSGNTKTVRLP